MLQFLQNTYLGKVYKGDKLLFVILTGFVISTFLSIHFCKEEFPVLLYGMYSEKMPAEPTYSTYEIYVDNKKVDYSRLWDTNRELMTSAMEKLAGEYENGKLSKEDWQTFQAWLFRYSADMRFVENNVMTIYKITGSYNADGTFNVTNRQQVGNYATQ